MNIEAEKGDKIIYNHPDAGYEPDHKKAKARLKLNEIYTVERTEVYNWHTNVYIKEFPDMYFNSVMFDDYTPKNKD